MSNLYPSLCCDDAHAAIEFLVRAFGFRERLVVPGPHGTVLHAELSFGPGVIMVGSADAAKGRIGPRGLRGVHQALSVRVDDPDAHFAQAQAAARRSRSRCTTRSTARAATWRRTRKASAGTSGPTSPARTGPTARDARHAPGGSS